jgi:HK97 family phage prohead protease
MLSFSCQAIANDVYEIEGIAFTVQKNRKDLVVLPSALKHTRSLQIPLLYGHMATKGVIGKVTKIIVGNGVVRFKAELTRTERNAHIIDKVLKGYIKHVSIGFIALETTDEGVVTKMDLLEISIVPIPADPTAVIKKITKVEL